jgi:hypothetical protein
MLQQATDERPLPAFLIVQGSALFWFEVRFHTRARTSCNLLLDIVVTRWIR